jgi:hypothetical protein
MPLFVLVHSPSVGPSTWLPVAGRLREAGYQAAVPSLLAIGAGGPPFWPHVVAAVRAGLTGTSPDQPLVLVAHSNAGVFVPVIARGLAQPVACSIFADATVPASGDHTPMVDAGFLPVLRGLAGPDGRLPQWTDWFADHEVAPMFPGPQVRETVTREAVTREQPRLPLDYYLEQVPVPAGWDDHRCAYLLFSTSYQDQATLARKRGWPVRRVPGEHLHQIVDPDGVAQALLALASLGRR